MYFPSGDRKSLLTGSSFSVYLPKNMTAQFVRYYHIQPITVLSWKC